MSLFPFQLVRNVLLFLHLLVSLSLLVINYISRVSVVIGILYTLLNI